MGVLDRRRQTLGFRHELIRQAVEASISAPRAAKLHARVVRRAGRRSATGASRGSPRHHAELAGLTADAALLRARTRPAEAERIGALREASLQLARVIRADAGRGDRESGSSCCCATRAPRTSPAAWTRPCDGASEALALARRSGDAAQRGRALIGARVGAVVAGSGAGGERRQRWTPWRLLEDTGDPGDLARAMAAHIRMEATAFDSVAAIEAGPRALELAARSRPRGGAGRCDDQPRAGARAPRAIREARTRWRRSSAPPARAGFPIQTIRAYVNGIAVAGEARNHAVLDDARRPGAVALFEESQTAIPHDYATVLIARSQLDRGRWDDALAAARAQPPHRPRGRSDRAASWRGSCWRAAAIRVRQEKLDQALERSGGGTARLAPRPGPHRAGRGCLASAVTVRPRSLTRSRVGRLAVR